MKHALVLGLLLGAACKTNTPPTPSAHAQVVYQALVDAGCIAQSDSGASDVALEEASDAAPEWFTCMWNGGSVADCGAPCSATSTKK